MADRIVGFDLFVWDWDGGEDTDLDVLTLAGGTSGASASSFKDGILVPCDVEDCSRGPSPSAVAANSWGRIKATLR